MGDPRRLRPDEVETFIMRELRKAGLELSKLKVVARENLSKGKDEEYSMNLSVLIRVGDADRGALIECRSERNPVRSEAVLALSSRLAGVAAQHGIMFSTSGYDADAVQKAKQHGIPVLTVADGKSAFARSAWGMAGQPPAWVPEYMSEVVDVDATGQLRHKLVVSGNPALILDRLKKEQTP
ncbi:MAG: restriction endonuclease [Gemmatimonadaceae bacterium]